MTVPLMEKQVAGFGRGEGAKHTVSTQRGSSLFLPPPPAQGIRVPNGLDDAEWGGGRRKSTTFCTFCVFPAFLPSCTLGPCSQKYTPGLFSL